MWACSDGCGDVALAGGGRMQQISALEVDNHRLQDENQELRQRLQQAADRVRFLEERLQQQPSPPIPPRRPQIERHGGVGMVLEHKWLAEGRCRVVVKTVVPGGPVDADGTIQVSPLAHLRTPMPSRPMPPLSCLPLHKALAILVRGVYRDISSMRAPARAGCAGPIVSHASAPHAQALHKH